MRLKNWQKNTPLLKTTLLVWQNNPAQGTALGKNTYKVRLAITSKGKGKRGGARVITCLKIIAFTVYLVSIYDKSVQSGISDKELKDRIKNLPE